MSSIQSPSATEHRAHEAAGTLPSAPNDPPSDLSPPEPRTAILLGLAFGASAGLATVLYLVLA